MFSKIKVSFPRERTLYRRVPNIQNHDTNDFQRLKKFQQRFTILHVTKYDVLASRVVKNRRKLDKLKKKLNKRGVYSQFRYMDDWIFLQCSKLPGFVMLCYLIANSYINYYKENHNQLGQLKTIQQVRQTQISPAFNIPLQLQNMMTELQQIDLIVERSQLVTSITDQIKKKSFILPDLLKFQFNSQKFQRQMEKIQDLLQKKNTVIEQINRLGSQMDEQKRNMIDFMNQLREPPLIPRKIARKSAPTLTRFERDQEVLEEEVCEVLEEEVQDEVLEEVEEDVLDDDNYNTYRDQHGENSR